MLFYLTLVSHPLFFFILSHFDSSSLQKRYENASPVHFQSSFLVKKFVVFYSIFFSFFIFRITHYYIMTPILPSLLYLLCLYTDAIHSFDKLRLRIFFHSLSYTVFFTWDLLSPHRSVFIHLYNFIFIILVLFFLRSSYFSSYFFIILLFFCFWFTCMDVCTLYFVQMFKNIYRWLFYPFNVLFFFSIRMDYRINPSVCKYFAKKHTTKLVNRVKEDERKTYFNFFFKFLLISTDWLHILCKYRDQSISKDLMHEYVKEVVWARRAPP